YQVVLSEDGAEARDIATKALIRYVGATTHTLDRSAADREHTSRENYSKVDQEVVNVAQMVKECRVIAGTPDDAIDLLTKAQDMRGFTQVDCLFYFGGIPLGAAQRSHRLFAEKVMPRLRNI